MTVLNELGPHTTALVEQVLLRDPAHARLLERGFSERPPEARVFTEAIAALVSKLVNGDYSELAAGYLGMCKMILEEEYVFRRTHAYRYATFDEVNAAVYQNTAYMRAYMNGILASQVLWVQHAEALRWYASRFLGSNTEGYRHLEVGPGHGVLLYHAATDPRCGSVVGWDVSPVSIQKTQICMGRLGVERPVELVLQDVMKAQTTEAFDSIVISEVCEHLERPTEALAALRSVLSPHGQIFINVPINAPCIDHIHLLRTIEEAQQMVERAGLEIIDQLLLPSAGYSIDKALRRTTSISCCFVARPIS